MSTSRNYRSSRWLIAGLVLLLVASLAGSGSAEVIEEDQSKFSGWHARPSTGFETVFAIACSDISLGSLPVYWRKNTAWQGGQSVPRWFADMSDSAYTMDCTAYPSAGAPYHHDSSDPEPGPCNSGGTGYADRILEIADDDIDYGVYDTDNDGKVDGFFFVIIEINPGYIGGCDHVDCYYTSSDTNSEGETVVVDGYYGVEVRIASDGFGSFTSYDYFQHICVHEWGHQFGLPELYRQTCCGYQSIGFSAMGNKHCGERCPPYDPYCRVQLGWLTPTVVKGTLDDQPIADHLTGDEVYKLRCSGYADNHFLVSNHTRESYWEGEFPGAGLLIWHIAPEGDNWDPDAIKKVDVEGADGLWDYSQNPPVRDDSTGQDSIDLGYPGVYHSFWNDSTKTCFDDTSSPNTRDYIVYDDTIRQIAYTGVWVRDIRVDPEDPDTAYADLFSPFEVWGPGTITFTGDTTIDSGYTVKVVPYTYIMFDTTDDQSGGYDPDRCELIVKGKLIARGIRYEPPGPKNVEFKSILDTLGAAGDWYGIVVDTGGVVDMYEARAKDAYSGVYVVGQAGSGNSIKQCNFRNNETYGVKVRADGVELNKNTVVGRNTSGEYGIHVEATGVNLKLNEVDSAWCGIYIKGTEGSATTIFKNEVRGPSYRGMMLEDLVIDLQSPARTRIRQCEVDGHFSECHIYLDHAHLVSVDTCLLRTGPLTDSCTRSPTGIKAYSCDSVKVRGSTIREYRTCGFTTYSTTTADLGRHSVDSGNNYIATTYVPNPPRNVYAVSNNGTDSLKAEDNYWGTDSPTASMFNGPVDYIPYLTGAPGKIQVAQDQSARPKAITLSQNYPNPFNPNTVIWFSLPEASKANLRIYNILGRLVRTVVDEYLPAGEHAVVWDGANQTGELVASGVYFYVLSAGDLQAAKKMVLLR